MYNRLTNKVINRDYIKVNGFYFKLKNKYKNMNKLDSILTFGLLFIYMTIICIYTNNKIDRQTDKIIKEINLYNKSINIELPEEYLDLSKDSLKPTVLTGYIDKNGKVFIQYTDLNSDTIISTSKYIKVFNSYTDKFK